MVETTSLSTAPLSSLRPPESTCSAPPFPVLPNPRPRVHHILRMLLTPAAHAPTASPTVFTSDEPVSSIGLVTPRSPTPFARPHLSSKCRPRGQSPSPHEMDDVVRVCAGAESGCGDLTTVCHRRGNRLYILFYCHICDRYVVESVPASAQHEVSSEGSQWIGAGPDERFEQQSRYESM